MLKILFCTCFNIFKNYAQKDLKNGFSKSARYSDWYLKYTVVVFLQIFGLEIETDSLAVEIAFNNHMVIKFVNSKAVT